MKNIGASLPQTIWQNALDRKANGEIENSYSNIRLILNNDDNLQNRIAFNEFNKQYYRTDFFGTIESESTLEVDFLTNTDKEMIEIYINDSYSIRPSLNNLDKGIKQVALNNRFNPVKSFIEQVPYDANFSRKISTELIEMFNLEDNEYNRWVSKLFFVSLVALIYYPSSKLDFMFIFEGSHSIGKTTFLSELAGEWYGNSLPSFGLNSDGEDTMTHNWVVNDDEMTAFLSSKEAAIKRFITETTVFYRSFYSGEKKRVHRHAVLVGTTNDISYLDTQSQAVKRRLLPIVARTLPNNGRSELFDGTWRRDVLPYLLAEAKEVLETEYTVDTQADIPTVIDLMTVGLTKDIELTLSNLRNRENLYDPIQEQILKYLTCPVILESKLDGYELRTQQNHFQSFLANPNTKINSKSTYRNRVSTKEIVKVAFYNEIPSLKLSRRIRDVMNSIDGWEYRSSIKFAYGVTSGWVKT